MYGFYIFFEKSKKLRSCILWTVYEANAEH